MKAIVVAGMAFGDEGKGSMVDYLVRRNEASVVVRYNGGCQCAHNVVLENGTHHTFSQFGSGTFAGADTFYSKWALLDLYALQCEADVLEEKGVTDPMRLHFVDPHAILITPYHRWANRIRELARGENRHGSVGSGVGEARGDSVYKNLSVRLGMNRDLMLEKIRRIREAKLEELCAVKDIAPEYYEAILNLPAKTVCAEFQEIRSKITCISWEDFVSVRGDSNFVFEGGQGVLLDERHGIEPYRTWTNTTFENAYNLCRDLPQHAIESVGVFRTYFTRHGPGPFPTETFLNAYPEEHNKTHAWMGPFRQGNFDFTLAEYAVGCAPPDVLAVTHMDRVEDENFIQNLEARLGKFVKYVSHGPKASHKLELCRGTQTKGVGLSIALRG